MDFKLGAIQSIPSHEDNIYGQLVGLNEDKVNALPSSFFHPRVPENLIVNQVIGDCVGQSSRYIKILQEYLSSNQWYDLNGDFVYYICKTLDGQPNGEGTQPSIAQKVLNTNGIPHRGLYADLQSNDNRPTPSQDAYVDAKNFITKTYARIQSLDEIRHALVEQGPVQIAVLVASNFTTPEAGGFVDLPQGSILGGHAICVDGFDDTMTHQYANGTTKKGFLRILNSWGANWGDKGYAYIPYDFLTFKTDIGMNFFMEAWSSVDDTTIAPPNPQPAPTQQTKIEMWINHPTAIVNGHEIPLDAPPVLINSHTMTPARFVAEKLGAQVEWDAVNDKVTITK